MRVTSVLLAAIIFLVILGSKIFSPNLQLANFKALANPTDISSLIPTPSPAQIPTLSYKPLTNSIVNTPAPTQVPTLTPTPTPTVFVPTSTPQPTQAYYSPPIIVTQVPQPTSTPAPQPPQIAGGNSFIDQINQYRQSKGLGSISSDSQTCNFANLRASEISANFSHDGFNNRVSSNSLPYPGYQEVTENLAMNHNSSDVVSSWINSPGHAANLEKNTPYGCVGSVGNYYAYEGWRP